MLRARNPVRSLTRADVDAALELCARDVVSHVFVAARILEAAESGTFTAAMGIRDGDQFSSLFWSNSNAVPVESTPQTRALFADKVRRWGARTASLLGPRDQVLDLWEHLEHHWGPSRAIRSHQPLLATSTPPSLRGISPDPRVRLARADEVDLVLPAAAHMFTGEIGYAPYTGNPRSYRNSLVSLIERGHTYVVVEGDRVIFKTDVGSLAMGCAQLQGVWLDPALRGRGLAVPMLAAVIEQLMAGEAPLVSLYVNDFNGPALAAYHRLGFEQVGEFATVII